jgi:hypothetical protein
MICNSYWAQVLNWAEQLLFNDSVLIPTSTQLAPRQLEQDLLTALGQLTQAPVPVKVKIGSRVQHSQARVYFLK